MIDTNVQQPGAPLTEAEQKSNIPATEPWNPDFAQKVATKSFNEMESYRQMNHDRRFSNADQLFVAWQPTKVWEGTRIPRSSLGVFLTMQQEETLLDNVMSAVFPLEENVTPEPGFGTSTFQARLSFQLILQQMRYSPEGYSSVREAVRQALKQGFLYGNGILEVSWLYKEVARLIAVPVWENPLYTQMYQSMTGEIPSRHLVSHPVKQVINQPLISPVDIRRFYIDPNTPCPDVQRARECAVRDLLTKEDLAQYRMLEGFDVPSDAVLDWLAHNKQQTPGDNSQQQGRSYNNINYQPTLDYTGNPALKRIELIRWYSKNREVWLLNRKWVMYNAINTVGVLPFLNAFYIDFPNSFYGLSIADVCEPEQRLQQSIINARIDELALSIHSPFVKKRGDALPQNSLRMVPGRVIELENPDQFKKLEWKDVTANSYVEVNSSILRAQKTTGLSDTATNGTPTEGGNSASRTATGITAQVSAAGKRIGGIINNLDSCFIEPLFQMLHAYNRKFLNPQQVFYLLGQSQAIDPLAIIHANVTFKAYAGRKMQQRSILLQAMPQLLPLLTAPEIQQQQAKFGFMLNMPALMDDIADALGTSLRDWWVPMSPELQQQQQMNSPEMIKAMTAMQMQAQRLQAQGEHQTQRDDTELLKTVMGETVKNEGVQRAATGYEAKKEKPKLAARTQ